jgi:hypothetical protein
LRPFECTSSFSQKDIQPKENFPAKERPFKIGFSPDFEWPLFYDQLNTIVPEQATMIVVASETMQRHPVLAHLG